MKKSKAAWAYSFIFLSLLLSVTTVFSACSLLLGSFSDCQSDADCVGQGEGLACIDDMCVQDPDPLRHRCATLIGSDEADAIEFGAIMAMTTQDGASNPRGLYRSKAIELALTEINQIGVAGRKLRVRICDSRGDNSQVKTLSQYLVDTHKVPALLTGGSADTIEASTVAIPSATALMAISASSPAISTLQDDDLVWRIAPSDALLGAYVATQMAAGASPAPKVAVLYVNDAYGSGLANFFFENYSGPSTLWSFRVDGRDLDTKLSSAAGESPQRLFIVAFSAEAAYIVNHLQSQSPALPNTANLFFADSMKDSAFFAALDDSTVVEGAQGASPGQPQGAVYDGFASRFSQEYGLNPEDQGYLAHSYDAIYCLGLGSAWALGQNPDGVLNGAGIAEGLKHLSTLTAPNFDFKPADFPAMASALQSGQDVNVRGASGELDFDPLTGEAPAPSVSWWIHNGDFQADAPDGTDAGSPQDAASSEDAAFVDGGVADVFSADQ